jgi:FAD/FMN-containing dehydrogenase
MSNRVAHYLQEHLLGEVVYSSDARSYFSTDGSILRLVPSLIVYPRNENDIRKTARFAWQLAERGRIIPLTARGAGTNQTGSAIGNGIIIAFTAHMNRILELNTKNKSLAIEPGINYGKLQQVLHTHGFFLPPYPPDLDYVTIGGAIASNVVGEKSFRYGSTKSFTKELRVVLANGEVIKTKKLSKRELSKKLGLATFEGEIYRSIDTLIEENRQIIDTMQRSTTINSAGYNLYDVKQKDGSFDLTPLIVGSEGTLGIISEAQLDIEFYDPESLIIKAEFDSLEKLQQALNAINESKNLPVSIELVDKQALEQIYEINPNHLKGLINDPLPSFVVIIEYEGAKKLSKSIVRILDNFTRSFETTTDIQEQINFRKIRESVNMITAHNDALLHSLPLFDGAVPIDRAREYLEGIYRIVNDNNLKTAIWGHIGDGNLTMQPKLNLGQVGDRQKIFRLFNEYYQLILSLNGTVSALNGDGRLRTPYLESMYGQEAYRLFAKVKQIFDPYNILNPGVKFNTSIEDLKGIIRQEFSLNHLYDHLPRS